MTNSAVRSPPQVRRRITARALASAPIPAAHPRPKESRSQRAFSRLLKNADSNATHLKQITRLRDAIVATAIGSGETMGGTVIALAGPRGGEGTSLTSLLLARALGDCVHRRIAWIDGSFDQQRFTAVARVLALKRGTVQLTKGQSQLIGYANREVPNAHFLRNESGENSLNFFSDQGLGRFISEVRRHFDFTVIDMPPIMNSTSSLFLLPLVDRLYLVTTPRSTTVDEVRRCKSTAEQAGGAISGVILNKQLAPVWSRVLWKSFFFA